MKTTLVVPTIREKSIQQFLEAWSKTSEVWDEIIVIEDNFEPTFDISGITHLSWLDIEEDLKDNSWIISRRDSAIKCYGFLVAYRHNADYIFVLDDDCLPSEPDFINKHIDNLTNFPKWTESVLGYRTRGIPYQNLGKCDNVKFSMGLWDGIPDFDSVQMLSNAPTDIRLPSTRIMPTGQYFPFCGMNFAFKREVAPLCYFPLMGMGYDQGRFDDIWFGLSCKKICDHLGYAITCGHPNIYHSKASNAFNNLIKEAVGIKINETLWQDIDQIKLTETTPVGCMRELGLELLSNNSSYVAKVGNAIMIWASLFFQSRE